ncbi:MAG: insulinase family protein [Bacteroidales bacterium]|nr:insulinase family protein [Bacteroidales bacterium]
MKRIITAVFAAAAMFLAASCSGIKYETVAGDPLNTKIYTLDNGLEVYMTVNKETPRIQTYIAVKVGAKNDPLETTGLAHYFEHLMFKGTEQFGTSDYAAEKPLLDEIEALFEVYRQTVDPAQREAIYHKIDSVSYLASQIAIPNEYDKLMALIGADGTNAWTSHDETVYTEDIPSNQIENWARIQSDRFMHPVLRGFHTELETIYEEKNMSLTQDSRKVWQALDNALYPHHPYGIHDVLGFQDHLKNPSITNVKKYHDTYYVPNNIRICLSGDFDPDQMVKTIEKYFGEWKPNPSIPALQYEKETPITSPIVRDIYGLESENVALGWRLPAATDLRNTAVAEIAGSILSNGQAGLMDLDLNQQQKVLSAYAGTQIQPDCSSFIAMGNPKAGQSLEELSSLLLSEVAKLRSGDFSESLIEATINNIKLSKMRELEDNGSRAQLYIDAFINGISWADACKDIERYSAVTKDDVVAWANEFLRDDNYVVIYKRMGEDKDIQKISAPAITPIATNRDKQSAFLVEMANSQVKPIEPVFVDFSKDMNQFDLAEGVHVLYKKNELNDIASVSFVFNTGSENDPALDFAANYIDYLGTEDMSAEQIATKMYELACSYTVRVGSGETSISVSGLNENLPEAIKVVENLLFNAKADEDILAALKADLLKSRADRKLNQRSCYSALTNYVVYGGEFIDKITLSNPQVAALKSEELLSKFSELYTKAHEILYYGPASESAAKDLLSASHKVNAGLAPLQKSYPTLNQNNGSSVVMAQYDAKQIYYIQYSNRGEKFMAPEAAAVNLYNEYFGGGMNTVVFQEMREARGLAYSAWARLYQPSNLKSDYYYMAFIATQNDKMRIAIEAFDDIINQMPESESSFSIAKEAIISRMRTDRTVGSAVLSTYRSCRELGLDEPLDKQVFETLQGMTLEDVVATQQKWVKGRDYTYAILGDIKDLDVAYLKTLGDVKIVSLEDIFGY